jgi:glycosyltransferase involved in cell wall biosynthesis
VIALRHVGLNLLHLVPGETGGVEVYDRRLVQALRAARPDLRLTAFVFSEAARALRSEPWLDDLELVRVPSSGRSRLARVAAEQAVLPPAVRRARIDLLHNLLTTAPVLPGIPQVTTIHDVIYKRYPETHVGVLAHGLAVLVPLAIRRSTRIVADSHATASDLVSLLNADAARIDVVYPGPGLGAPADPLQDAEVRRRLRLDAGRPLVLTVSAKRPHKNLERLVAAFAAVRAQPRPTLLVPGYPTPFEERLHRQAAAGGADVRFAGWIEDDVLDGLYRAATCVVLPSLREGFGLPVLEAMARGTPVACSDRPALPEVAGDAALYFDPTDETAIARTIEELLRDEGLRAHLGAAGREQARRFSWADAAASTLESYEKALQGRR